MKHKILIRRLNKMIFRSLLLPCKPLTSLSAALFITLTSFTFIANAAIDVVLAEPDWEFLLDSRPIEMTSAKLDASEGRFAQRVRPLLNEKNYAEAAALFAARDIAHDSAALRQLRGQVLLSLKRFDEAEQALQAAIDIMPNLALAHRSLSMLYMLKKEYGKASEHLTKSIELGVADAQLYGQLAFINLNNHHAASAIVGYQQALYLQPENTQWQQGLLYAWLNSHNYGAAQRLVDDMLEQGQHANPVELWLLRSQIALQMHKPKHALSSMEIALHLAESGQTDEASLAKHTQNQVLAAKLHVQHGSVSRAVELLTSSLGKYSSLASTQNDAVQQEILSALAQILPWLFNQGEDQKAAALLSIAESIDVPVLFQAKMNMYRGQLAFQQGKTKSAIQHLSKAVAKDPRLGEAILSLANAYQKQGQVQQAQRYFVRASTLPGLKVRALLSHAQLQIEQKTYPQALDLLLQALKVAPNRQDIRNNVHALQTIIKQGQYES
ncbi:tetratricopeptide repeat protein [Paraglaciecola sp. 2405UD69-4]|uniref:tetratricopeptide repeat protein n=1 Tax=Paraglaciecola sp. 2405UD69-4 TaxID=3391836 RepID=UPI0039C92CDE